MKLWGETAAGGEVTLVVVIVAGGGTVASRPGRTRRPSLHLRLASPALDGRKRPSPHGPSPHRPSWRRLGFWRLCGLGFGGPGFGCLLPGTPRSGCRGVRGVCTGSPTRRGSSDCSEAPLCGPFGGWPECDRTHRQAHSVNSLLGVVGEIATNAPRIPVNAL